MKQRKPGDPRWSSWERGYLGGLAAFLLMVIVPFALVSALTEGIWEGTILEDTSTLMFVIAGICVVLILAITVAVGLDMRKEKHKLEREQR